MDHGKIASGLLLLCCICGALSDPAAAAEYRADEVDRRIQSLINDMTVEEKLGQLTLQWGAETQDSNPVTQQTKLDDLLGAIRAHQVGAVLGAHGAEYTNRLQRAAVEESRLHIPLLVGNDVVHGYRTVFPIPLAEACSWDEAIIMKSARVAATEARAAGTNWTFAPMVDICRDPRWGRVAEGAGEDPYLGSIIAVARVRGFQGDDPAASDALLACAKHFVGYGAAEGGRDYNTVDISLQTLRDVFLPPFHAAVSAGAGSIMSSFNEINGLPATAHRPLLTDLLRQEWQFQGFVVSDWTSITEMVAHGYARDPAHAAVLALAAGIDMDMCSFSYRTHLAQALTAGEVSETQVNEAVRRVLQAKFRLGLFENPYADPKREPAVTLTAEHRAAARDVARHGMVLLKNENDLLPIRPGVKSIALIGPLADNQRDLLGTWAAIGRPEDVVTVLAGIRERAADEATVQYARGCDISQANAEALQQAIEAASQSDLIVAVLGESEDMSGEAHSRSTLDLPAPQRELLQRLQATGKPVVLVIMSGRPLCIPWAAEHIPAILQAWHPGVEGGRAVADILFGDFNPSGRLCVTVPRHVGQVPMYYAHKNTGRPPGENRYTSKYVDLPPTPLYPFGYGLGYSRFRYANLKIDPAQAALDGRFAISADITNTGKVAGIETAQLYVRDVLGSLTRPVRELKGFQRLQLEPGETRTVRFDLPVPSLGFHNADLRYVVEPGQFQVWIGPHAAEGLEGHIEVMPAAEAVEATEVVPSPAED
jgi:beta-glucosidase